MSHLNLKGLSVCFKLNTNGRSGALARYKQFFALDQIDLEIKKGDRIALLGRNGAGKTTLLRVLSGVLPPTYGELESEGVIRPALTLSLGMMGQASCLENIRLAAYYNGLDKNGIREYIKRVREQADIDEFIHQPVKTLSKGMRSKLVISMALVEKSDILIFDEWIAAVDRQQLEGDSTLSDAINSADIFVVATHKMNLVEKYCNRCLILDKGKIIHDLNVQEGMDRYKEIGPSSQSFDDDDDD